MVDRRHNNGNNYNGSHNNCSGRGGQDNEQNNNNNNYNRSGGQNNGNNNNYGPYHNSINIGDGFLQSDRPYDFFGNGHLDDGNNDGTFGNTKDARFVNYGGEYGRHQRTYNHTSSSRFDPTRNSHNHLDYGMQSHQ